MKTKAIVKSRDNEPKQRGSDSAAERLRFGLDNREISRATKDELLKDSKDNKKSKKEVLDNLKTKIVKLFTNENGNDDSLISVFKKDSIVSTDLGFRFMPDAFEVFKSFKGTIYSISSDGIPYAYNIELTEEQTSVKDANNKKMIMNAIHPGAYIIGFTAFGVNKEYEPKNVCMLFNIPFYNEDVNKKHFVINMLNYLKDLNKDACVSTIGTTPLDLTMVPKSINDWVDNAGAPIKVLAAKRIDDMQHTALYNQLVLTDNLDEYSTKMLKRIQYSSTIDKYKASFIPEPRDGQIKKMCFLYWDTKTNRFLISRSSTLGKQALRLAMSYSIMDAENNRVAKQAMFKFSEEHKNFIRSIVIDSEKFTLSIN